ncbi:hypothetical protein [Moorena sp. SIO2C4]|uniref:hypothetical protein n=1 Tax=Moorena sp. SIO2C4 TaxID=2607824 RepID=UPI000309BFCB|nr:hypothetical protein [Moorena sp. SIO2C4]NEQ16075.1 hypothetical protein [Moorena sp. SIO3E2]NES43378.1 hypothetical protein [Moorena sp. SIO2C4]
MTGKNSAISCQPSANQQEVVNQAYGLVRLVENPCSFYSSDPVQLKRLLAPQVAWPRSNS